MHAEARAIWLKYDLHTKQMDAERVEMALAKIKDMIAETRADTRVFDYHLEDLKQIEQDAADIEDVDLRFESVPSVSEYADKADALFWNAAGIWSTYAQDSSVYDGCTEFDGDYECNIVKNSIILKTITETIPAGEEYTHVNGSLTIVNWTAGTYKTYSETKYADGSYETIKYYYKGTNQTSSISAYYDTPNDALKCTTYLDRKDVILRTDYWNDAGTKTRTDMNLCS